MQTTTSVGLKFGLFTAGILIIYDAILQISGLASIPELGFVSLVVLLGGMVVAMNTFKKGNSGFMSYKQGLGIGTILIAVAATLSKIFNFCYINFIDDSNFLAMIEKQRTKMEEKGMDAAIMEKTLESMKKNGYAAISIFWTALGAVIIGFIISLIVAAIMKKNNPEQQA